MYCKYRPESRLALTGREVPAGVGALDQAEVLFPSTKSLACCQADA